MQLIPEVGWDWGKQPAGVLPLAPRLALAALGGGGGGGAGARARGRALLRDTLLALEQALLAAAGWRLFAPTPDAFLPVLLLRSGGGCGVLAALARTLLHAGAHSGPSATGAAAEEQAEAALALAQWALREARGTAGAGAQPPLPPPRAGATAGAWILRGARAVFGGGAHGGRALVGRTAGAQWRAELVLGGAGELYRAIAVLRGVGE
jgi:hypothetical protein